AELCAAVFPGCLSGRAKFSGGGAGGRSRLGWAADGLGNCRAGALRFRTDGLGAGCVWIWLWHAAVVAGVGGLGGVSDGRPLAPCRLTARCGVELATAVSGWSQLLGLRDRSVPVGGFGRARGL